MPALSPTMEEGTLAKWFVKEGDRIQSGDLIAEIETDKATMEFEAVDEGIIGKLLVSEGSEGVKVNSPIAVILDDGEELKMSETVDLVMETEQTKPEVATEEVAEIQKLSMNVVQTSSTRVFATPLARRLAREKGIDLGSVTGSGPHGRIVKTDILDLKVSDVDTNQENLAKSVLRNNVQQASGSSITNLYADREYTEIPLNSMRKTVAARLTEAKQNIPHFYLNTKVNMNNLLQYRKTQKQKGNKYSFNAILMQSIALAFDQFSDANCTYKDNGEFFINKDINIGIAVDTSSGLKMPVLKNINSKDLSSINNGLNDLINITRENKISPSDLSGGVISISNLGAYNIRSFDAIILPGQTYILAVGQIFEDVYVNKGKIEIASFVNLTLSCDHRAVDGVLASQFLSSIVSNLEKINNDK